MIQRLLVKKRLAPFAPAAPLNGDPTYYTKEHRPRYLSPVGPEGNFQEVYLRTPIEHESIYHRGYALYTNPSHREERPRLEAYWVEDVGIVPATRMGLVFSN